MKAQHIVMEAIGKTPSVQTGQQDYGLLLLDVQ
jgi:hypothetical protein